MAPQTKAAPTIPSGMWHKARDARSRTPSPMYLELQRPSIRSADDASGSESGFHTPRGNVSTAAQGMPTWQQSLKGSGAWDGNKEARQVKSYGEPMPAQFAAGPYPFLQDQIWSAHRRSTLLISDRFFNSFPSTNGTEFVQILEGICACIDVCETSTRITKRDAYCTL